MQFLGKTVLPAGFSPPTYDVFAYGVEFFVLFDHLHNPVWEEIDVCIAMGGQHTYSTMFPDETMPNGKTFLFFHNIAERVCCGCIE